MLTRTPPTPHPLRMGPGRIENVALWSLSDGRYMMGCGHESVPNLTVCSHGCIESPNWSIPVIRHPEWDPYLKRAYRKDKALAKRLGAP
jgi:hypothetical protein